MHMLHLCHRSHQQDGFGSKALSLVHTHLKLIRITEMFAAQSGVLRLPVG